MSTAEKQSDQPDPPSGSASLNLKVDGQQYVWRYQYPRSEKEVFSYVDMVVPVGMTITLDITADDVVHSWWIPKLGGKMDAIPPEDKYGKPGVKRMLNKIADLWAADRKAIAKLSGK